MHMYGERRPLKQDMKRTELVLIYLFQLFNTISHHIYRHIIQLYPSLNLHLYHCFIGDYKRLQKLKIDFKKKTIADYAMLMNMSQKPFIERLHFTKYNYNCLRQHNAKRMSAVLINIEFLTRFNTFIKANYLFITLISLIGFCI